MKYFTSILLLVCFICCFCFPVVAQKTENNSQTLDLQGLYLPADTMVTTQHEITVKGQEISYTAIAGTQPVYAEDGHILASLFYVYYKRNGVQDTVSRPLLI